MRLYADFGEAITGIGFQYFDTAGLVGSRSTAGITNPTLGVYLLEAATPPVDAVGIYWNSGDGSKYTQEVFDSTPTWYTAPDNAGIAAVKAKTDNLPVQPAAVGSAMNLANDSITSAALAASAVVEIQSGLFTAGAYVAPDNTAIGAIQAKTNNLPANPAAVGSAMTLAPASILSATFAVDAITANAISASAVTEVQSGLMKLTDYVVPPTIGDIADGVNASLTSAHGAGSWQTGEGGSGSGLGAFNVVISVNDGENPLQNAWVRVTEGVASYVVKTDGDGAAAFSLDAANYVISITKAGYFFEPATLEVTESGAQAFNMEAVLPTPPPSSPELCRVHGYLINASSQPVADAKITFDLQTARLSSTNDQVIGTHKASCVTNDDGYFEIDLLRNDAITPAGSSYLVSSSKIQVAEGEELSLALNSATYDLESIIVS